jgi:hypothetical protein
MSNDRHSIGQAKPTGELEREMFSRRRGFGAEPMQPEPGKLVMFL